VRRLAEGAAELPTEVRAREARDARHVGNLDPLVVARVSEILGSQ
jgi:hypothetical protein